MYLLGLLVMCVIGYTYFSDKKTSDNKNNHVSSDDKIVRININDKTETLQTKEIIRSIDVLFPIYTKVSGVSNENRQQCVKKCRSNQKLTLVREKDNPYDENAIAVHTICNQVGYIKKELASKLAPLMDGGALLEGYVEQVTGGNDNLYGLNIKIIRRNNKMMFPSIMLCMDEPTQHIMSGRPFKYSKVGIRGNIAYIFEYYSGKCYKVDVLCGSVIECSDKFDQDWDDIIIINKGSVLWCIANTIGICAMMWSGSSPYQLDDVFISITEQLNYNLEQCSYKACLTRYDWTTIYCNKRVDLCNLVQNIPKDLKLRPE